MCHSVTHTWDGVQPPHTAPSYLPFSLNDLMSGTTVRVVFYMLHHSFTLQTGWLCTQPIASRPVTTEIAPTPRLVRPLISDQNSGTGAMAYPLSAIAGMLINVDIYVDRHYTLWSRRSHTTLLEISASVPDPPALCNAMDHRFPDRTRSTTRTHTKIRQHHTFSNRRLSDARCNDIGTRKLVHLSSYAHSYSAPCSSRSVP